MKQKLFLFFLIAIIIILFYISCKKKHFTKIFEFFDNTIIECPEGYGVKDGKCKQICAHCKLGVCQNGVCGSAIPNVFPI